MSQTLSKIYLVRHGQTAWSLSGQHTGLTDLPLTGHGEHEARALYKRLAGLPVVKVFTSPLRRAKQTCALAGFEQSAEEDADLVEWDYGDYEGLRSVEIHSKRPDWQIYRDGCPGGESPAQVGARADRVLKRARGIPGDVLIFSSGHFLRMVAARWVGLEPIGGQYFDSGTASLSALGFENTKDHPVIEFWNNTSHLDI
jgi:broad specificity phosphatase PhoE